MHDLAVVKTQGKPDKLVVDILRNGTSEKQLGFISINGAWYVLEGSDPPPEWKSPKSVDSDGRIWSLEPIDESAKIPLNVFMEENIELLKIGLEAVIKCSIEERVSFEEISTRVGDMIDHFFGAAREDSGIGETEHGLGREESTVKKAFWRED